MDKLTAATFLQAIMPPCYDCGSAAYYKRDGINRCPECDADHVRALAMCSSGWRNIGKRLRIV